MAVGLGARILPKQWLAPFTAKANMGRRAAAVAALAAGKSKVVSVEHVVPWSALAKSINSDQFQRLIRGRDNPTKFPPLAAAAPMPPAAAVGVSSRPQHTIKRRPVGAPPSTRKASGGPSAPTSGPPRVNPFAAATLATPQPGAWAYHVFGVQPPPARAITSDPSAAANEAIESAHDAIAAVRNGHKQTLAHAADWASTHAQSAHAGLQLEEAMLADNKRELANAKATARKTGSQSDILHALASEAWGVKPGRQAVAKAKANALQATEAATFVGRLAARGPVAKSPADLALFGPEARPTEYHATQGQVGDCWLLTTAGSAAKANPDAIKKLFKVNSDGSVNVTLHNPDMKLDPQTGRVMTHTYTLRDQDLSRSGANRREPLLQTDARGTPVEGVEGLENKERPPHEQGGPLDTAMPGTGTLSRKTQQPWVAYLEEAANRLLKEHPSNLDAQDGKPKTNIVGGTADMGTRILFGKRTLVHADPSKLTDSDLISRLRTAYKDPIFVSTNADEAPQGWPQGLVPGHAYQVAGVTTRNGKSSVTLRNPHFPGVSSTTTVTLAEFQKHVANFSNLKDSIA